MIRSLASPLPPPLEPSLDALFRSPPIRTPNAWDEPAHGWASVPGLLAFAAISFATAAAGARTTRKNKLWYGRLRKSSFNPPDRTFSRVWPVLYGLGAVSAWLVARAPRSPSRTRALRLWGAQMACNAAWTPLFFGARRPGLAMGDLVANFGALGAYALEAKKVAPVAALLVTPYLAWLAFAGTLNASIVAKNQA